MNSEKLTYNEWVDRGRTLFGDNIEQWRFKCPSCGRAAAVEDWTALGARHAAGVDCVSRYAQDQRKPCSYAGGGLFKLNPVEVTNRPPDQGNGNLFVFEFD